MSLTVAEILKGCEPGKIQSVGYMQIIPLTSKYVDDNIAPPTEVSYSNSNYGSMTLKNKSSDKFTAIPFCCGIMTKQDAQNHGMPDAKILAPSKTTIVNNAACIQQTQGGHIRDDGKHNLTILPWSLREVTWLTRKTVGYQKLWPAIAEFNHGLGVKDNSGRILQKGHLEFYMDQFKEQLDEFIGEYEIEPNMVGAIILMNGEVVGIERAPNYAYWKAIWKPLIRESYGSLALIYRKKFGDNPPPPKTRIPIDSHNIKSISDLKNRLNNARKKESDVVRKIINSFIKKKFKHESIETVGKYKVDSIQNEQFLGQIVLNGETVPYCSLVTSAKWIDNPKQHGWSNHGGFSM